MKKIAVLLLLVLALALAGCESSTFDCVIENNSDYPAELFLLYHKKATNTNNDTVVLKANEKTTIAFYYEGDNVRLTSKNYNVLEKVSARKYVITNLEPTKYNIHNLLPIEITFLDNGKNILADKDTKKLSDTVAIPTGISECYFFRKIKSDDIVLQPIENLTKDSFTYSVQGIAGLYFLKSTESSKPTTTHEIRINISADNIIISN